MLRVVAAKSFFAMFLLGLLLAIAFIVRAGGATFGFPLLTHPDEFYVFDAAHRMIETGDPDPHFFNYPSLYLYTQAAVQYGCYLLAKCREGVRSFSDVPITRLYYVGRLFTVLLATLSVLLTFHIAKKMMNRWLGLLAAAILTFSSLHIVNSYYITVDLPMSAAALLAIACSMLLYEKGPRTSLYLLNGLVIGLAIGVKYTALWSAGGLLLAHYWLFRGGKTTLLSKPLIWGLLLIPLGFFITTPYALIKPLELLRALHYESAHYRAGHQGMESPVSYGYYWMKLHSTFGAWPLLLAVAGLAAMKGKKELGSIVAVFPLIYFFFMGSYRVRFERNMVAVLPFLAISAAYAIYCLYHYAKTREAGSRVRPFLYAGVVIALAGVAATSWQQYRQATETIRLANLPDTRLEAGQWIKCHVPDCARIGREHYTPETAAFHPLTTYLGICGLLKADIQGLDYIITSSGDYGRFFKRDGQFPQEAASYQAFFNQHKLVKEFAPDQQTTSGPTIRIYQTVWANPECLHSGRGVEKPLVKAGAPQ